MNKVDNFIEHLSEKPWGAYTGADYTLEQWHRACLIHQHEGPPTSKSQCKLPVKTPSGALNRNGVHAAAAALAGARAEIKASPDEKKKAANALMRYYRQMDESPPASLMRHSNLEHHGVKGMRWGVRRSRGGGSARKTLPQSAESKRVTQLRQRKASQLTNKQLERVNRRLEMEQKFSRLNPASFTKGETLAKSLLATAGIGVAAYNTLKSPAGQALIRAGKSALAKKAAKKAARLAARRAPQQLTLF